MSRAGLSRGELTHALSELGVVNGVLGGVAGGLGTAAGTVYLVKNSKRDFDDETTASLESRKFGWKAASHADSELHAQTPLARTR